MQMFDQKYFQKVYSRSNRLDGQFKNMIKIYDRMYGSIMPFNRNAHILDVACGAGQFLKYLDVKGYTNYVGIDHGEDQVKYVRNNVTKNVICAEALGFLSMMRVEDLDLIVANDFIEHLPRETGMQFVELCHKALKPGGRIILKTGNMAAFGGLVILYNGLDHECGFTERSLYALLAVNDFTGIQIIPDSPSRLWVKLFEWALKKLYKYIYMGNYPRHVCKIIAVTGIKL